jgi:hypothetical protein
MLLLQFLKILKNLNHYVTNEHVPIYLYHFTSIFYILLVRVSPAGRQGVSTSLSPRFRPLILLCWSEWTEKVHSSLPSALALSEIPDLQHRASIKALKEGRGRKISKCKRQIHRYISCVRTIYIYLIQICNT